MNMLATAKIHDLAALTATPWESVEKGSLYLRDGVLEIATIANGRPFFCRLTGQVAFHLEVLRSRTDLVACLPHGLRVRAVPLTDAEVNLAGLDMHGCLAVSPAGLTLCASLEHEHGGHAPSGRVAIPFNAQPAEFHEGRFAAVYTQWEITWLNANDEVVASLRRATA